jgi:hypothetical protein
MLLGVGQKEETHPVRTSQKRAIYYPYEVPSNSKPGTHTHSFV